jgi:hypothetical protein
MPKRKIERLIFIFDADSGAMGAIVDTARKLLMIKGCALCQITHGVIGEKQDWKSCKEELGVPIDYLHRDDIPPSLESKVRENLPCIVAQVDGESLILLKPDVINRCRGGVADLRGRLRFYAGARNLELPGLD